MRTGTKHLRIASLIQIVIGIASIFLTYFLIDKADISASGVSGETAFGLLIASYAGSAFQIIAGLLGLILSNKKSLLTVILGVLLFIPQLISFFHTNGDIVRIIISCILLIIPYYYLHNAYKNLKSE